MTIKCDEEISNTITFDDLIQQEVIYNTNFAPDYIKDIKKEIERVLYFELLDKETIEHLRYLIDKRLSKEKRSYNIVDYYLEYNQNPDNFGWTFLLKVKEGPMMEYNFYRIDVL